MIPFFEFTTIHLGVLTIQVWGLFVSLGITTALIFAYLRCKKQALSAELFLDMAIWILIGAFIMARIFHVVFYSPIYYLANPQDILKFWQGGASSLGGFVGAGMAIWLFAKKRKLTWQFLLPYFDIAALSLWLGWGIGRIGCFLIHDHPGTLSSFILAVQYPGGARFDLGLLESILGFVLFIIFYLLYKKLIGIRAGLVAALSVAAYAFVRFWLDFLRIPYNYVAGDIRYGAFTPAQWGMLAILITLTFAGLWLKMKQPKN